MNVSTLFEDKYSRMVIYRSQGFPYICKNYITYLYYYLIKN
jgi:hypothetical protein